MAFGPQKLTVEEWDEDELDAECVFDEVTFDLQALRPFEPQKLLQCLYSADTELTSTCGQLCGRCRTGPREKQETQKTSLADNERRRPLTKVKTTRGRGNVERPFSLYYYFSASSASFSHQMHTTTEAFFVLTVDGDEVLTKLPLADADDDAIPQSLHHKKLDSGFCIGSDQLQFHSRQFCTLDGALQFIQAQS